MPKGIYKLNPEQIQTDEFCSYGCGNVAKYKFKNGNICCVEQYQQCLGILDRMIKTHQDNIDESGLNHFQRIQIKANAVRDHKKAGENISKAKKKIGEDGLTNAQRSNNKVNERLRQIDDATGLNGFQKKAAKTREIRLNDIDDEGLNSYQRAGYKANETAKIPDENGISNYDRSVEKLKEIGDDGLNGFQRRAKAYSQQMRNNINEDGLDGFEQRTLKRINDIDDNGLNSFERAFEKSLKIKKYKDIDLYYQGSYEYKFLEELENKNGLQWVKNNIERGPTFSYIDPKTNRIRQYFSDFIINSIVYEIKSSWTWNKKDKSLETQQLNEAKIKSVNTNGYDIILIIDGKEIFYAKEK